MTDVPTAAIRPGGDAPFGGTLTIAYQTPPFTLDPAVAWELTDVAVVHTIFQGLFRYVAAPGDEGVVLEPCLANDVPTAANGGISPDGCTITVGLRPDVRFHEPVSRAVTASDFKYSFERMMDPRAVREAPGTCFYDGVVGAGAFRAGKARAIDGFEALDPTTLRIRLARPDPSFVNALAMDFCSVVPREWVEKWGPEFGRCPLGCGPFVFDRWTANREIVLRRNPDYWEPDRPRLDGLTYVFNYAPATALTLLESGQIDVLGNGVPPTDVARLKADPAWRSRLHSCTEIASEMVFLNVQMRPFTDVRVRRAVSWAIDRDKLVRLLAGQGVPLYQLYPRGLPGHDPAVKHYGYDPARARRLLAEAGLAGGFQTSIYSDSIDPNPELMRSVAADLAAIGIRAEVKVMAGNSYSTLQSTPRTLEMGIYGWWLDFPDPVDWIVPLFGKNDGTSASVNSSFWSPPQLDQMLRDAQTTAEPSARLAKFRQIQDYIMSEAPYVTLYTGARTNVSAPRVGGFYQHPVYDIDPAGFWVDE